METAETEANSAVEAEDISPTEVMEAPMAAEAAQATVVLLEQVVNMEATVVKLAQRV